MSNINVTCKWATQINDNNCPFLLSTHWTLAANDPNLHAFYQFFFLPMSFSQFLYVAIYSSEAIIYENCLNEIYQHISYFYTKNKTTFKWMFRSINVINALLEITLTLVQNSNDKYTFPPNIMFCTNRLMYATIHDTTYPIRLMLPVTLNAWVWYIR